MTHSALNPLDPDVAADADELEREAIRTYLKIILAAGEPVDYAWLRGFAHALTLRCLLDQPELAVAHVALPGFAAAHLDSHLKPVTDVYELITRDL